jgi:hypothetical protein
MRLPQLLCLAGKAGVGKDTLADYLVAHHGYVKYRFADTIKKLLNARFGWTMADWERRDWKECVNHDYGATFEWAGADPMTMRKEYTYFSPRSWVQWLGTEVGRTIGGKDVWVDAMWRDYTSRDNGKRMVVCDARYDNEAASFWARGGDVLRIERPGVAPVLAHASEAGISEEYISCTVVNDCSMDEFLTRAMAALQTCGSAR